MYGWKDKGRARQKIDSYIERGRYTDRKIDKDREKEVERERALETKMYLASSSFQ